MATGLLAIGTYGGTSTISVSEARRDLPTILSAVTVGIVLEAALVGVVLWLAFDDPLFILLAVMVAQIDPLHMAALMKDSHLSPRARTVLASWSAFDGPVTVIFTLTLVTVMGPALAVDDRVVEPFAGVEGLVEFAASVSFNLALVACAVALWPAIRRAMPPPRGTVAEAASVLTVGGLAVWRSLLLGLAVVGLFMRPQSRSWGRWVERAVAAALCTAAVMLGVSLAEGINVLYGVSLGVTAYCGQVVVGFVLTRRLPHADRVHLALSQQNGITSIVLALTLEPFVFGVVAVIGPAVITINLLHYAMGRLARRRPALFGIGPVVVESTAIPLPLGSVSRRAGDGTEVFPAAGQRRPKRDQREAEG